MLESQTTSITIPRNWQQVCESIWRPQAFPRWASGLSQSPMEPDGTGWWKTQDPDGPARIRFTDHNAFDVMDHTIEVGGAKICVPMRIAPNGEGAEVLFTLFRQPGMSDEKFAADAAWVARDLAVLKVLVTA